MTTARTGTTLSVRRVLAAAAALLLAGCGQPTEPSKQAEDLGSIAAEGALLAHGAAHGSSTGPFTRVHSEALRKALAQLEPNLKEARLARIAADIGEALDGLPDQPARAERQLDTAAEKAEELAR
jgi:hypothetical protein